MMNHTRKITAILPRFTALASVIGSSMIVSSVLRNMENRRNTNQRLLLSMSLIDIIVSTVWLLTNFFVPKGYEKMYYTWGNKYSCDAQGFIVQFSISAVIYNSMLSLYYFLVIHQGWKERMFKKIESYMHVVPISFGLATAVVSQILGLYNPVDWDCWIGPSPDCEEDGSCESEGNKTSLYRLLFFYGPLWISIIFAMTMMILVYRSVKKNEKKSQRWKFKASNVGKSNEVSRSLSKEHDATLKYTQKTLWQSIFYVGSFFITWIFPTITRVVQFVPDKTPPDTLIVLSGVFLPMQGMLNSFVYFRPRIETIKRENPDYGFCRVLFHLINANLGFCCIQSSQTEDRRDIISEPMNYQDVHKSLQLDPAKLEEFIKGLPTTIPEGDEESDS